MRINIVNRKTGHIEKVDFKNQPLKQVKRLTSSAAASTSHYFISLIAESKEDITFISDHFINIPLPDMEAQQAIWTGDLAVFLILNYPVVKELSTTDS